MQKWIFTSRDTLVDLLYPVKCAICTVRYILNLILNKVLQIMCNFKAYSINKKIMTCRPVTLLAMILSFGMVSCISDIKLDEATEPMLQIDAILYADSPMQPVMIRQVFKATGTIRDTVRTEDLWVQGAEIELYEITMQQGAAVDSVMVGMVESSPGHYVPEDSGFIIKRDRRYRILVRWQNLKASATAEIPQYSHEGLRVVRQQLNLQPEIATFQVVPVGTPDDMGDSSGERESVEYFQVRVFISQFIPGEFVAIQVSSDTERSAANRYLRYSDYVGNPLVYSSLLLSETNRELLFQRDVYAYFPLGTPVNAERVMRLRVVTVVPEDIYADYLRVSSSFIMPATVTNVHQGVGLFIGAVRDTSYYNIRIANAAPGM